MARPRRRSGPRHGVPPLRVASSLRAEGLESCPAAIPCDAGSVMRWLGRWSGPCHGVPRLHVASSLRAEVGVPSAPRHPSRASAASTPAAVWTVSRSAPATCIPVPSCRGFPPLTIPEAAQITAAFGWTASRSAAATCSPDTPWRGFESPPARLSLRPRVPSGDGLRPRFWTVSRSAPATGRSPDTP